VLFALGRRDEANAAARRTLELDPNDVGAIQVLVAGDDGPAGALGRLQPIADANPSAWGPSRVAGDLAMADGDVDAAVGHWRRAVESGGDDATIGTLLGELGRAGRIDELVEIADGVTRLADRDPGLRWNVAAGYAESGRSGEARIVFASIAHDARVPGDMRAAAQERVTDLES
jgi:Flp pilus assembly protein TadD